MEPSTTAAAQPGKPQNVGTPLPQWQHDEAERDITRVFRQGTAAIRKACLEKGFMLPFPGEEKRLDIRVSTGAEHPLGTLSRFEGRVRESVAHNYWRSSIVNLACLPGFERPVLDGWGPQMTEFFADVDGTGRDVVEFFYDQVQEALFEGLALTLVNYGRSGPRAFKDAAKELPRWLEVPVSELILWHTRKTPGGEIALGQFHLRREVETLDLDDPNRWTTRSTTEVVVLRAGDVDGEVAGNARYRVYRQGAKGGEFLDETATVASEAGLTPTADGWIEIRARAGRPEPRIMLVPWYGERVGPFRGRPPFRDECEVQLEAFRRRSEFKALLRKNARFRVHMSGVGVDDAGKPILSLDPEEELYWSAVPGGDAKILESTAAVLTASAQAIEADEQYVRTEIGRAQSAQATGRATATEIGLRSFEVRTRLEKIAAMAAASLETLARMTADVIGEAPGSVRLERKEALPNV